MIYLASPYTHTDPDVMQERFEYVRAAAAEMLARGEIVYSPIVHGHAIATAHDLPTDFEFWMRHSFAMLERADNLYVLRLDGWLESRGVTAEIGWWKRHRRGVRIKHITHFVAIEGTLSTSPEFAIEGASA
jgi:hypothetical protein